MKNTLIAALAAGRDHRRSERAGRRAGPVCGISEEERRRFRRTDAHRARDDFGQRYAGAPA